MFLWDQDLYSHTVRITLITDNKDKITFRGLGWYQNSYKDSNEELQ